MADLALSASWWGLDDKSERAETKRDAVWRELSREIVPEHELSGQIVRVEAFFRATDDVIVRLPEETFAVVHPTWSGKAEPPPYPITRHLGGAAETNQAIARFEYYY